MKRKYKVAFAAMSLLGAAGVYTAQASVETYPSVKDTYLDKDNKDTNYGNSGQLLVAKNAKGNALLSFDLDNTPNFPTNDCNLTADIAKAELVVNVTATADCADGCQLEVRSSDAFTEGDGASGAGST